MRSLYRIHLVEKIPSPKENIHLFSTNKPQEYIISEHALTLLREKKYIPVLLETIPLEPLLEHILYPPQHFLYSPPETGAKEEICAKILAQNKNGKFPYAVFLGRNRHVGDGTFFLDRSGSSRNYQWRLIDEIEGFQHLRDAFPRLIERVTDRDTKFVLSLGAGGLRLFAHASVMKFLNVLELRSSLAEIWGCSGGSVAGLAYAMGVDPDRFEQEGYDIYNQRYKIAFTPSVLKILKNLVVDSFLPMSPDLLKGFLSCQESMHRAVAHLIEGKKMEIPFYCVAYNVKRQKHQILTPLPVDEHFYQGLVMHADPIDAIVASSSIPLLYIPKTIRQGEGEEEFIDGAIAEEIPLLSIYRKWRFDCERGIEKRKKLFILAIDLFSHFEQRQTSSRFFGRLPFLDVLYFSLGVLDLMRFSRLGDQTEVLRQDPNVYVAHAALSLKTRALLNAKEIPKIIEGAQTSVLQQMVEMERLLSEATPQDFLGKWCTFKKLFQRKK